MNSVVTRPYFLTFEDRGEYLYANIKGENDSFAISTQYWGEVYAECRRRQKCRVLVHEELREQVSVNDGFSIACHAEREDFAGLKIAFVDQFEDHASVNGFTQTISHKRGRDLEIFRSVADAERWLLEG